MKIDVVFLTHNLADMPSLTRLVEEIGFDGLWTAETNHDPFLPLALAAEHSQQVTLGTAIAVAFPRTPAILAYIAWDLARFSKGRFVLGLGPQVKAHNVLRLGAQWEKPVTKLRETILAIRAFWDCWQNGTPLNFRGEFFKLRLMTPFFNPGPHEWPEIPIYIAAVNEKMLRLAGEVCDGVHIHALHSVRYLREFAMPHIEAGLKANGRNRTDFTVNTAVFAIPTDDPAYAAQAEAHARQQISFYMSTPAYRVLAQLHGWENTAHKLSQMARNGQWDDMPKLITDEILAELAVTGTWAELPTIIHRKYGNLLDRVSYYLPFTPGYQEEGWRATVAAFRQLRENKNPTHQS
ncbi:MAG: TIGR03617 family F420-dependent LLM class oxidoreductase [Chloroflexi bacterium]|nr:MAG: TIGR03617 family F420-dependent LLM class oxidoreductase [Chloroflexota bacterium]